jgi:hypothetical protein
MNMMSKLHVERVSDVDPGDDGHIEYEMPGEITIILHPRRSIAITAAKLPFRRMSEVDGYATALAEQLERLRHGNVITMRVVAFGCKLGRRSQSKFARYSAALVSGKFNAKNMRLLGMLIRVRARGPQISVGLHPNGVVDILTTSVLSAKTIHKGFVTELLDKALQTANDLFEREFG